MRLEIRTYSSSPFLPGTFGGAVTSYQRPQLLKSDPFSHTCVLMTASYLSLAGLSEVTLLPVVSLGSPPSLVSLLNPFQASVGGHFTRPLDCACHCLDILDQTPIVYSLHQDHLKAACFLGRTHLKLDSSMELALKAKRAIISWLSRTKLS